MIKPYYEQDGITIYNADCREVLPTLAPVGIAVTSPPYNMRTRVRNGQYTTREWSDHFSKKYSEFHDAFPVDEYKSIHEEILKGVLKISPLAFYNIQIVTGSKEAWFSIIGAFARQLKDVIIWDKGYGEPAMHDSVVNRGSELVLAFESAATAGRAFSKSYFKRGEMSDIWRINRGSALKVKGHGATFPVSLAGRILANWSSPEDVVLDVFCGTGSTLVAAKAAGQEAIGIEISERYCEIAAKRLAQSAFNYEEVS